MASGHTTAPSALTYHCVCPFDPYPLMIPWQFLHLLPCTLLCLWNVAVKARQHFFHSRRIIVHYGESGRNQNQGDVAQESTADSVVDGLAGLLALCSDLGISELVSFFVYSCFSGELQLCSLGCMSKPHHQKLKVRWVSFPRSDLCPV